MGSTSRIEKVELITPSSSSSRNPLASPRLSNLPASAPKYKTTVLELFTSGDLPLGNIFLHRHFDSAMVAFLECIQQLGEHVEMRLGGEQPAAAGGSANAGDAQRPAKNKMPYLISKDKIGDACIRLAFNQNEAWTRACKYTLTCVKWLLAQTRWVKREQVGGILKR